jgi:hypothetical protein
MSDRRARDLQLLDAIDAFKRVPFEGNVWRIVPDGRDPLQGYPAKARWDPGTFDVLYTSLEPQGSLAEIHFHLSRQPVFPSKLSLSLFKLEVRTSRILTIADMRDLENLGVTSEQYPQLLYDRTQSIGDAAYFLGFDGMTVPSARWNCQNLILFTDQLSPTDLRISASRPVDWDAWREEASALKVQRTRE